MVFLFFMFFFFFSLVFFILGVYLFYYSGFYLEIPISNSVFFDFSLSFCVDFISLFFFSSVSLIASMVFLYSKFYMTDMIGVKILLNLRFFSLIFFFVISMSLLVFSGSWLTLMVGWDGLGLVSFLLVIYYNDSSSLNSGIITFLTNRLGDSFFILGFIFFFYFGWVGVDSFSLFSSWFIFFCLFGGAITKSAQVPFSSWLPAAMAAPTPVSSLVHSSTLVTAGVYLLIRFNFLFHDFFFFMSYFSLVTLFGAGFCALWENDFKKVVAMSTLSQLGFMLFSLSLGYTILSFLHMVFHAFFKSSLFLSTGNLMGYVSGGQDYRFFGAMGSSGLSKVIFCVSCLSLMGFPFSLGFYSKDLILGSFFSGYLDLFFLLFFLGCSFTVGYSFRLIFIGFFYFPSFSSSLSFSDDLFFFLSILTLYFSCVFIGNFYFYFFSIPLNFSFIECFLGLLIIVFGLFFYLKFPLSYSMAHMVSSIGFLSSLVSYLPSFFINKISFKVDYSWSEFFGVSLLLNLREVFLKVELFIKISFSFFILISFFLLIFVFSFYD